MMAKVLTKMQYSPVYTCSMLLADCTLRKCRWPGRPDTEAEPGG